MKVRHIYWYRKEAEMFRHCLLGLRPFWTRCRYHYNPVNLSLRISTREEFERHYLEWKAKNEG